MKVYAERNASESMVEVGDTVVLKHENRSKLDPNFKPEQFTVTGFDGSDMVVCADKDGSVKRPNMSFAKKLQSPSAVGTEEPQGVAIETPRPLESSDFVVLKEPLCKHILTDTISTGFTTWTTRFRFHYTVLLVFL